MKQLSIRILCLLLSVLMLLPLAACGNIGEDSETDPAESVTEGETEYDHGVERTNYDAEFNVVIGGTFNSKYHIIEESEGDDMSYAVYERLMRIEDYIGVKCAIVDAGSWTEYAGNVSRMVQAGGDDYSLVMTHVYQGITELITSNSLFNYEDLPSVNLDAPYWNNNLMEELRMGGKLLLGYNDYCLSECHTLTFNKSLMARYNIDEPYDLVRNKQWTIDTLFSMASQVCEDDGDGKRTEADTYGIHGWGWVDLIDFVTASNLKIVDRDPATDEYYIAYEDNQEKLLDMIQKVFDMYHADYSWMYKTQGPAIGMDSGRILFSMTNVSGLATMRDTEVPFGILPYPLYDTQQTEYRTLNWNGMLCIPGSIKNVPMVSDTMELLNAFAGPVKTAFYEQLLGAKIANAPDDAAMLDVIWNTLVSDIGLICANAAGQMDALVYMVPKMCEAKSINFSSYMKQNKKSAQKGLENMFKGKKK